MLTFSRRSTPSGGSPASTFLVSRCFQAMFNLSIDPDANFYRKLLFINDGQFDHRPQRQLFA